jgi:hypothetical protein
MQCITKWEICYRRLGVVAHTVAVLSLVMLTATGVQLESIGGWIVCPLRTVILEGGRQKERRRRAVACGSTCWMRYWLRSWVIPAIRSEALMALVFLSEARGWEWVWVLPWAAWLWKGVGMAWPRLGQQPVYERIGWMWEKASGVALVGLGLAWATRQLPVVGRWGFSTFAIGSCIQGCASRPDVAVEQDERGVYHVRLRGEFELHVNGEVELYKRMLVIFLGLLEMPGEVRKSRRTRDGRTPFVRQEQMACAGRIIHPFYNRSQ